MKVLGIDFGTTSFSGSLYDSEQNISLFATKENTSHIVNGLKREFDLEKARADLYSFIKYLGDNFNLAEVEAVSITGNMHSFFLVKNNKPVTNIITWQDERVLENYKDGVSYVSYINNNFKSLFSKYQHLVSSGYAVTTLLYLLNLNNIDGCSIHFAPDFIIKELIGKKSYEDIFTDYSLAHSSGLYALENNNWNYKLIDALGYSKIRFPKVAESGTFVGYIGEHIPVLKNTPIYLGMGDNQASVLGTIFNHKDKNKLKYILNDSLTWLHQKPNLFSHPYLYIDLLVLKKSQYFDKYNQQPNNLIQILSSL